MLGHALAHRCWQDHLDHGAGDLAGRLALLNISNFGPTLGTLGFFGLHDLLLWYFVDLPNFLYRTWLFHARDVGLWADNARVATWAARLLKLLAVY